MLSTVGVSSLTKFAGYGLLLYSRLNDCVTLHKVSTPPDSRNHSALTFDRHMVSLPSSVMLPSQPVELAMPAQKDAQVSCIAVHRATYEYRVPLGVSMFDVDQGFQKAGNCLYKLFLLRSDLSLVECMYVGGDPDDFDGPGCFAPDGVSSRNMQKDATAVPEAKSVRLMRQAMGRNVSGHSNSEYPDPYKRAVIAKQSRRSAEQWTVNSEVLYSLVTQSAPQKPLNLSSLTLDELEPTLSVDYLRELLNRKSNIGASGVESL